MEPSSPTTTALIETQSAVSWDSIAAGAVAAAALSLVLVAFGTGLGLSAISPWSNSGVSASTFSIATGIYLIIVAVMSSAIGGYLAGRLRTKWSGVHGNEVFFRDTAHGLLAWALATILSATALSATTAYLTSGTAMAAASTAARSTNPAELYVDKLFRNPSVATSELSHNAGGTENAAAASPTGGNAGTSQANSAANSGREIAAARAEVLRLWTADFTTEKGLTPDDKTYVTQLVAARTGMSQADAQKRVDEVVTQAKEQLDATRNEAAKMSFWLTAALLFGAFAASLAAAEGGVLRDGTWNGRVLTPRTI